jgi:centrosomal protein CEP120
MVGNQNQQPADY